MQSLDSPIFGFIRKQNIHTIHTHEKISTQNNGPGINIYRWSMVHLYLNSHMTLGSLKKRWGKQSNRTIWKLDGEYIYKCWDFKTKGRNKIQNKEVESFMGGAK